MKAFHVLAFCALFGTMAEAQAAMPQPPCGGQPSPAYPAPMAAPAIAVWHGSELEQGKWQPPACIGWQGHSKLVVGLAGSFRYEGKLSELLIRAGAISALPKIQYWSITDKKWRPLVTDAAALSGSDPKSRRGDFSGSDMKKGAELYYWEDDSRTGEAVYRLKVLESTPERAVIASENATRIRRFITLFQPGAVQSVIFIERVSPGIAGVYTLSRTGEGTSSLADGHDESYVNRAVALYRYLAGIKTDQEPPPRARQ